MEGPFGIPVGGSSLTRKVFKNTSLPCMGFQKEVKTRILYLKV